MDEHETVQQMSDLTVTVESRQERVLQRLHQTWSVDHQLDTENCQTWVEQGLDMSENNYVSMK